MWLPKCGRESDDFLVPAVPICPGLDRVGDFWFVVDFGEGQYDDEVPAGTKYDMLDVFRGVGMAHP